MATTPNDLITTLVYLTITLATGNYTKQEMESIYTVLKVLNKYGERVSSQSVMLPSSPQLMLLDMLQKKLQAGRPMP